MANDDALSEHTIGQINGRVSFKKRGRGGGAVSVWRQHFASCHFGQQSLHDSPTLIFADTKWIFKSIFD